MVITDDPLYSPKQLAALLGVHLRTVQRWLRTGELKGMKAGRSWRVRQSDLEQFMK